MRGSFRPLVNPATPSDKIDLEGTREKRELLRDEMRLRQLRLEAMLAEESPLDQR